MSVLMRYQILLKMTERSLIRLIDQYNAGGLHPKTRLALEILDGIDGPGDRVVGNFELGVAA